MDRQVVERIIGRMDGLSEETNGFTATPMVRRLFGRLNEIVGEFMNG